MNSFGRRRGDRGPVPDGCVAALWKPLMRWKRRVYWLHRWLGLVVSLQLLAWSVGGFTFTILDIDDVHGDFEKQVRSPPPVRTERVEQSPADAISAIGALGTAPEKISRVSLRERFDRTVYEFFDLDDRPIGAVDATTGVAYSEVSEEEIRAAAVADFAPDAPIISIERLEGEPPLEFRGGAMPVYRVIFEHPKHTPLHLARHRGDPKAPQQTVAHFRFLLDASHHGLSGPRQFQPLAADRRKRLRDSDLG